MKQDEDMGTKKQKKLYLNQRKNLVLMLMTKKQKIIFKPEKKPCVDVGTKAQISVSQLNSRELKMIFDLFAIGLITAFFAVPLTIWMWSSL